ncbi:MULTISPECIES: hypothetical protein [Streptomyces]|uniref:hypothetical protein n=1 Tax=Streptomyces TaxID=1883 RepID=UPI00167208DC|nr:hypothetical protein [Streptomyces canarius]
MSQNEVEALRQAGRSIGHVEFAERMVRALSEGLRALEALPHDDEFWHGWANDHAMTHKLGPFAAERLDRDPTDPTARWALVALALAHGAHDGGLSLLGPQIAADPSVGGGRAGHRGLGRAGNRVRSHCRAARGVCQG